MDLIYQCAGCGPMVITARGNADAATFDLEIHQEDRD